MDLTNMTCEQLNEAYADAVSQYNAAINSPENVQYITNLSGGFSSYSPTRALEMNLDEIKSRMVSINCPVSAPVPKKKKVVGGDTNSLFHIPEIFPEMGAAVQHALHNVLPSVVGEPAAINPEHGAEATQETTVPEVASNSQARGSRSFVSWLLNGMKN